MDDDGFTRYAGPKKKVEVSRKELLGVGGPRVPKAKARQQVAQANTTSQEEYGEAYGEARVSRAAYDYEPESADPLRRADQRQLEQLAVKKTREVTHDLKNVLKISEDTKTIGAITLSTLKEQGDQITRVHEKAVQLEQEMAQSERFLNKLGGMFSAPWKVKKGKKISGPQYDADMGRTSGTGNSAARADLLNQGNNSKAGSNQKDRHGNYLDDVEDEAEKQDDMLDQISSNLSQMKLMAQDMGKEMSRQDKALDSLQADTEELHNRERQSVLKSRKILGRRA